MNCFEDPALDKPTVLVVCDAVAPTGFSRVSESLLSRLSTSFDFHQLSINYFGDPHSYNWKLYPAIIGGDPNGVNRLEHLVRIIEPSLVLIIRDLNVVDLYVSVLQQFRPRLKVVAYLPIDSGPVDPSMAQRTVTGSDAIVTYTQYGKNELLAALKTSSNDIHESVIPSMSVLPHGVDTSLFHPIAPLSQTQALSKNRMLARAILGLDDYLQNDDAFIVLNANRNQPRKRIDCTLEGFSIFAKDKPPNVKLYLHMAREDQGWDVFSLAKRFGIEKRLLLTTTTNKMPDLSSAELNAIYNACDVGVNTSFSEGWGLVAFEHAATYGAQIIPRHTAMPEIWRGVPIYLDPVFEQLSPRRLSKEYLVSAVNLASSLDRLYYDRKYLLRQSLLCYKNATRPIYHWDYIASQWKDLLLGIIDSK
jgi:glycosyltransferase involved in cell wall biosynthesis